LAHHTQKKKKKKGLKTLGIPQNKSTMALLLLKIMIAQNEVSNTLHINEQASQIATNSPICNGITLQIDLCVIE
jgi:hypothetical protein